MEKLIKLLQDEGKVLEVAKALNVSKAIVYAWRNGKYFPNNHNRKKLNELFGCDFFVNK